MRSLLRAGRISPTLASLGGFTVTAMALSLGLAAAAPRAAAPAPPAPQEPCRAAAPPASRDPNIFTHAQEVDLGEALAESFDPLLRVIDDESLNAPLRRIGEAIVRHLPPTDLRIRFTLADFPDANAFVLPGGRVYVSRKLLTFFQDEDELAGVLGHELGHLIARQQTIALTRQLRELLNVSEVGDRGDIAAKFHRLLDNSARKPGVFKSAAHTERDQVEADRLGLFAVAAAGFDPAAHVRFFDRFAETEGRTGSVLSTFFGTTSPDARRLRELIRTVAAMPATCARGTAVRNQDAFRAWQLEVGSFSGVRRAERLPATVSRTPLAPALRGEITRLRFSPDGRHVLAQDDTGISVLTRDPLAVLFRIPAEAALPAQFTPDSRDLVFHTPDLRVERWRLADRRLVEVRNIVQRRVCRTSALSPDGQTIGCVDMDGHLVLIDVAAHAVVLERRRFFVAGPSAINFGGVMIMGPAPEAVLRFSTDGRFFAAGYSDFALMGPAVTGTFVYDVPARKPIDLRGDARRLVTGSFAFTGPDRLIGLNADDPAKSGVIRLPDGAVVETVSLLRGQFEAPSRGPHLLVRPVKDYAVGVLDLANATVTKGHAMSAFDAYDDHFVAERGTGDVGLYRMTDNQVVASVTLPASPFGVLYAAAASPDLRWLAASERTRGAVWDLSSGERVTHIRGFRGAAFDDSGVLVADLPKSEKEPRAIARIEPARKSVTSGGDVTEPYATQFGRWLIMSRDIQNGVEFELRDLPRGYRLWARSFPGAPPYAMGGPGADAILFAWPADSPEARERIRQDEALRSRINLGDLEGDFLFEVVDAERGTVRGRMLLETGKGSFSLVAAVAIRDLVVVTDTNGRVMIFDLATGAVRGHAFGHDPVVNLATGQFAVNVGGGLVVVYDLVTFQRRQELQFRHPVATLTFSADGGRLLAVTTDQVAHVVPLGPPGDRVP